jgi:hypothetical protein
MLQDTHVPVAEGARGPMPNGVTLCGPVEHWICATVGRKGTLRAAGQGLYTGIRHDLPQQVASEDVLVRVAVDITKAEASIAHLGKHSRFIRRIDVAIVVVGNHRDAGPSRALKIHVARCKWREHLAKKELRKELHEVPALPIEFNDAIERGTVER